MTAARGMATGVDAELDRYMQEVTDVAADNGLLFWQEREHSYTPLAPLAEDFVSAPASQAYVERVFTCVSYAEARNSYRLDVRLSVCPSVRPSHAGTLSKRLNVLS